MLAILLDLDKASDKVAIAIPSLLKYWTFYGINIDIKRQRLSTIYDIKHQAYQIINWSLLSYK